MLPSDTPDHPLGNTKDVAAFLADSINQLRRGQLDPRVANAMGYLASIHLRALEQGPVEERLAKIEAILSANAQPRDTPNESNAHEKTTVAQRN